MVTLELLIYHYFLCRPCTLIKPGNTEDISSVIRKSDFRNSVVQESDFELQENTGTVTNSHHCLIMD